MKAFLLAAGLGTRLKPFTDKHPKALADVNGQTLLERNIRFLIKCGIQDIVVNIHHFANQIIEKIAENKGFGANIIISDESNEVLETGGGLKYAATLLEGSDHILMMNVDILCDFNLDAMLDAHTQSNALATLAVQHRNSSRELLFGQDGRLHGWSNNQTGEVRPNHLDPQSLIHFAFSGIQLLRKDFLSKIKQEGKFSIIDTYLDLCATEIINAWNHSADYWLDVGKPEQLALARAYYNGK